jgi:hypothetical protein
MDLLRFLKDENTGQLNVLKSRSERLESRITESFMQFVLGRTTFWHSRTAQRLW